MEDYVKYWLTDEQIVHSCHLTEQELIAAIQRAALKGLKPGSGEIHMVRHPAASKGIGAYAFYFPVETG